MKACILSVLCFIATSSFAQCVKCTSFEEALKKPAMVKSLIYNGTMDGLRLDSIPSSIGQLVNLEILYLTDHYIKTIPPELGNLKKLKGLSFGGCELTSLPDFIFSLTNLEELILFDNKFTESYKKKLKLLFKEKLPGTDLLLN